MSRSDLPPRRRVLVVDDSAFMRRVVRELIEASGEFDVVGVAYDGEDAIRKVHALDPDIVTLDIEMPGLDGLDVLRYIMREACRPVVMLSAAGGNTPAHRPDMEALEALELGAVDFVRKPSGPISLDLVRVGDRLLDALRAAACMRVAERQRPVGEPVRPTGAQPVDHRVATQAVCIAASTGGPAALAALLPHLAFAADAAVLIVQHMPAGFTASFADRLDRRCGFRVREAQAGERVEAHTAYVAPGGLHMRVVRSVDGPRLMLERGEPLWGVRPAADALFTSAASVFHACTTGVVLTGMGRDGSEGLRIIRSAGGRAIVQDPAHAVLPGMPTSALRQAGADVVAPLEGIPAAVLAAVAAIAAVAGGSHHTPQHSAPHLVQQSAPHLLQQSANHVAHKTAPPAIRGA